jgi:hypothetical protein
MTSGTTQRLAEIDKRNLLRREAGLPLLSVVVELRRMHQQKAEAVFNAYYELHAPAVLQQILRRVREETKNPHWKPNFLTGMAIANEMRCKLIKMLNEKEE